MHFPQSDKEFKDFLIQETEQHRMYASDEVWNNIHKQLHGQKRWPALGIISFVILSCLSIATFIFNEQKLVAFPKNIVKKSSSVAKTIEKPSADLFTQVFSNKVLQPLKANHTNEEPTIILSDIVTNATEVSANNSINNNVINIVESVNTNENNAVVETIVKNEKMVEKVQPAIETVFDNSLPQTEEITAAAKELNNQEIDNKVIQNIAENSYVKHAVTKTKRWNIGFYTTPSISYRRLIDVNNKSAANPPNFISTSSANFSNIDVNQVVKHRPALGIEAGISVGYKVNDRVIVKGGLQFNLRRYTIQTYGYQYEPTSITLNNGNQTSTVNVISQFRTASNSGMPINISNKYYEISIPVGLDWIAIENKKVALHIAGAVQPTYVLDKNPFLITSDYKNYANGKSLMRNFNINSSAETYLQFKQKNYSWQIGPQFRYQQLPSFNSTYPIREHLFDFGMKLGITRNF
jgi:hypothetical protein